MMERISYQDIPEGMFNKLMALEQAINNSGISIQLLEIIRLRVSQINGCAYCVDMHHKELKQAGETELRLSSLCVWRDTHYFSEQEQAVLEFTEKLTLVSQEGVPEGVYQQLSNHFDKAEIAFLSLAVTQINTWTRLMRTFRFTPGNYQPSAQG
ncbi:MAG: carboxymuconolactone decarboxylase family protein [Bacteroidota bacterium]